MQRFEIVVKTLYGLEEVLAHELAALGVEEMEKLTRAVSFMGDKELLYRCNLELRTAMKVLKPIAQFYCRNEKQLYNKIRSIDWSEHMRVNQTLACEGVTSGHIFRHSKYVALKSKDAIVDQFREGTGRRPSVDLEDPDLRVNVHIRDTTCTVSLNSSGEILSKRGYRRQTTLAPIMETLAAGIILMTGWDGRTTFIDPMCGSGTFPVEAAMISSGMAPGRRRAFGFEKWRDFDPDLWDKLKRAADNRKSNVLARIIACDQSADALKAAEGNARRMGMGASIDFRQENFLESEPLDADGLIVMNPPYGERLQDEQGDIVQLYNDIGARLKHHYENHDAWIISSNVAALKRVGLKPSKKVKLMNGSLECMLYHFELYRGSKKAKAQS